MLLERLRQWADLRPAAPAIQWSGGMLDYATLAAEVERLAKELRRRGARVVGLALPNGAPWAVADLAALAAEVVLVPIPPFFSPAQVNHCLRQAGVQALLTLPELIQQGPLASLAGGAERIETAGTELAWLSLGKEMPSLEEMASLPIPDGVAKITYTSGTTGAPKGVMLTAPQMERVALALLEAAALPAGSRHLCIAPLSILLENIGGLYAPLLGGHTTVMPSMEEVGLRGAAGFDAAQLAAAFQKWDAHSAILSPALLQGLVEVMTPPAANPTGIGARPSGRESPLPRPGADSGPESDSTLPQGLRFLAVGGAGVAPSLLERAAELGLPVYQGYGLSECASVVTLNRPGDNRPGSVGRPLPHWEVRIAANGEVQVRGDLFRGYLGEPAPILNDGWWSTGDLGRFAADGFLFLEGRRKNLIVTAFGRNVAPEWVENELLLQPAIAQAALFGDARPWNLALITPSPGMTSEQVEGAIAAVNATLPDYARAGRWLATDAPFSLINGQLTGTGRLRREAIQAHYRERIEQLYQEDSHS